MKAANALVITATLAAAAVAMGSCAPPPRPPATDEVGPPSAGLPSVTPSIYVPPVYGTDERWFLNDEVAGALLKYDIAASTEGANGASYVLYSMAEAKPASGGLVDVTFYWDLVEPGGELVGTVSQTERMTSDAWHGVPSDLPRLAKGAAARIVNVVPGQRFELVDPSVRVAARAEREKLEERRRLYRKMASRGGLGPLSKRLFSHAEAQERQARAAQAETADGQSERLEADAIYTAAVEPAPAEDTVAPPDVAVATPTADATAADAETPDADVTVATESGITFTPVKRATADHSVTVAEPPTKPHWVNLAAFPDEADARSYWLRLRFTRADLFSGHKVEFMPVDMGDRGTFYRVDAGPFTDVADAVRFCGELRAARVDCAVPSAPGLSTVAETEMDGVEPATAGQSEPTTDGDGSAATGALRSTKR
jgi:hypothetical protein